MEELNSQLLARVEYDIKLKEEEISFKRYQKIYTTKKKIFQSSLFLIIGIFCLVRVLLQPELTILWGIMGIAIVLAAFVWVNAIVVRKNLLKALKNIEGDRYQFDLYNEYFSIKTIQLANNSVTPEGGNTENKIEVSDIEPRIVKFDEAEFKFVEEEEVFIIFLKNETYYTIPKRCMDIQTQETIRSFFNNLKQDIQSVK